MSNNSGIEWTGSTWNPLTGCTPVSAGCKNCYAAKMTKRLAAMGQAKYQGLLNSAGQFNGKINFDDDALSIPLKRRKPTTWFVNSMSDLFHEAVSFEFVDQVFSVMALCPQHTFQVLTKRPERMREYVGGDPIARGYLVGKATDKFGGLPTTKGFFGAESRWQWPFANVWLGTSVENQSVLHRIDELRGCPAVVRFLSLEPLLEDLGAINLEGIDWVICGGESGSGARPMHPDWARELRDQCVAAGVPFFMKQMDKKQPIPDDLMIRQFPEVRL